MINKKSIFLEMKYYDNTMGFSPYKGKDNPSWEEIQKIISKVFEYGGNIRVRVVHPDDLCIQHVEMEANPHQFRLLVMINSDDITHELLEWWEPEDSLFRGTILFGDDYWDARTVCEDFSVAERFFRDFYENIRYGSLSAEVFSEFRFV